MCFFLHKRSNNKKLKPTRLNAKFEFINKHMPDTIIRSIDLIRLAESTKRAVQIRDVFVHGIINSYDENEIKIGKIDGKSSDHLIEIFTIDRDRLEKSAQALSDLGASWSNIAVALYQHINSA